MNNFQTSKIGMIAPGIPKPKKRGIDIFQATFSEYNLIKSQLKQDQFANLVCLVGGKSYDVFQVTAEIDHIKARAKDENGDIHILIAPIEQITFDIVVSKKTKGNEGWGVKFMGFETETTKT